MTVAPIGDCACVFEEPQTGKLYGLFFHVLAKFSLLPEPMSLSVCMIKPLVKSYSMAPQTSGLHGDLLTTAKTRKCRWYSRISHSTGTAMTLLRGIVDGTSRRDRQKDGESTSRIRYPFTLQTKTYTIANSVDPDWTARNEPSHRELHCLLFVFFFIYYFFFTFE